MNTPLVKHNPAFLTDEELVRTFVVRHDDREMILSAIKENTADSNQHVLVIGPRGIGKTMLVRRVALSVQQDESLCHKWYPLIFAEESYEVASAGEFWLEALFHLGHQTGDDKWTRAYEDLKREPVETRLHDRALAQLMDFADSQGKCILLIVENLNMILGEQLDDDNAWKLRHTLMHEPRVMLLATATTRLDPPENTHKAMFEMFKTHVLRPLNDAECQALWLSATGEELGSRRIRAVSILTGGNPRLLTIISRFGARLSFAELMADMTGLVDDHTDYFKSHLDALPPTERKAYVALADLWDPSTARDVALASRLGVSMTSSLLKRLVSRGAVIESAGKGRTKRYQVAERMYNIYYLMRRRGSPSERVRAVVQFMVQFYEEKELVDAAKRLTEEACRLPQEDRECHYHAFAGLVKTAPSDLRSRIVQCTPREFLNAPDCPESLRQLLEGVGNEANCPCESHKAPNRRLADLMHMGAKARREGRIDEARKLYQEATALDDMYAEAWMMLGRVESETSDRLVQAEQAFRRAAELAPRDPCVWGAFGRFLARSKGREAEAEQAFRRALEIYPDCSDAWFGLARLFSRQSGRCRDAAKAYREAEEACVRRTARFPGQVSGWRMLARTRHRYTNRFMEAEAAYKKALDLDPNDASTWAQFANLLAEHLKRYDDAESAYRRAIAINPHDTYALSNLACLLRDHLEKDEEAEDILRGIIARGSDNIDRAWMELGSLYEKGARYDEAGDAYRKAIEHNPKHICPYWRLGGLLHIRLRRYDEAERTYRTIIELDADAADRAWTNLGTLHEQLGRYQDAESDYRKAVEVAPSNAEAWALLGFLLHERLGRYEEAEAAYRKALEMKPKQAGTLTLLGQLLGEPLGRRDAAEQAYIDAITADKRYVPARTGLATLALKAEGQCDRALQIAREAVRAIPGNANLLNSLAWAFYESGHLEHLLHAEQWARKAVELKAEHAWIHTLACVLGVAGKVPDAIEATRRLLDAPEFVRRNVDDMVRLFAELVAAGAAEQAYPLLRDSKSATALEPVAVALQMHLGIEVHVAPEIAEVAKDVLKRFGEVGDRRSRGTKG